ncbi:hypothetical protein HHK36_009557 [Tetracentron sinense]|uniref:ENTH domain-containing protein n=1 Tax=Tetracentron sinense TaxID=13715 RepID=A0A834ZBX3_TETSI|nr:hypothetical protein HHK36_009557 [Tetracentron sinense]
MGRRTNLRDLIGVLKDKASLSKAALLSKPNTSSANLAVLRATTHEPSIPPNEKHVAALLSFGHSSRATASTCIEALMDRLQNTHNSSVALKCLITVHIIIKRGSFILQDQLSIYPSSGGRNYLNLSNFRDYSTPKTWELSLWVRWYARVLEQLLLCSRVLGFFLCSSSYTSEKDTVEEKVSALLNRDLLREIDALVGVIEEICRAPDSVHVQGNSLVYEVMEFVRTDYLSAQNEILLRVIEFRERLDSLSFGESVELVCTLKRLEECKERLLLLFMNTKTTTESIWDLVSEIKNNLGMMKECRNDGRLVRTGRRERGSESARFGGQVVRSGDSVLFSSGRVDLNRVPFTILESVASDE